MTQFSAASDWKGIAKELIDSCRDIAEVGKFDEAILAAFKHVESRLQARLHSNSTGETLLSEGFDEQRPKIQIGERRDREYVRNLFSGALGFVRSDRAHKDEPVVPCRTKESCLSYMHFAQLLLYLLSKDKATLPQVTSKEIIRTRDFATIQLSGSNLQRIDRCIANGEILRVVRSEFELLEARLPSKFVGEFAAFCEDEPVYGTACDTTLILESDSCFEILDVDIPVYSDGATLKLRGDCVGLRVGIDQGRHTYKQIWPTTPGRYRIGQFVTFGPWRPGPILQSWYRDASGTAREAWGSSLMFNADVIGDQSQRKTIGLNITTPEVCLDIFETRTLRALASESYGQARRQIDVTNMVKWNSSDEAVAYVDSRGVLRAKRFGEARITCKFADYSATAKVSVANPAAGDRYTYFRGPAHLQKIRFDSFDNLYITNQSAFVWRLRKKGGLESVLSVASLADRPNGLDSIAVDESGLYVSGVMDHCLYFPRVGEHYGVGRILGGADGGTKKGLALGANGELFVGVMGTPFNNHVLRVAPDLVESTFSTRDTAHNIAVGPDGRLYIPADKYHVIDVCDRDGLPHESIDLGTDDNVSDITIGPDGNVYVATFYTGTVLRFDRQNHYQRSIIATGVGILGGIAVDSSARIFVSEFPTGRIDIIYQQ